MAIRKIVGIAVIVTVALTIALVTVDTADWSTSTLRLSSAGGPISMVTCETAKITSVTDIKSHGTVTERVAYHLTLSSENINNSLGNEELIGDIQYEASLAAVDGFTRYTNTFVADATSTPNLADAKRIIPTWVRIQRIQRDIPSQFIEAGVKKSNLRQLVNTRLHEDGYKCRCIRCREAGLSQLGGKVADASNIKFMSERYGACGGTEYFLSFDDVAKDILIALLRLRFPSEPHRNELKHAALVRDLHAYGELVGLGERKENSWQHRGYGARLLKHAEEIAIDNGYRKIAVMSGIGVREYYARVGYEREGPYMVKILC